MDGGEGGSVRDGAHDSAEAQRGDGALASATGADDCAVVPGGSAAASVCVGS